ncbi:MAG: ComEC/Rec2 family competence protein [Thermomicrobium sp.]|nr:ComEC/Rec2 family competence protein [Thermomicrobium sp.]MDW7982238.1 ComEC/Rec2 family competence protein [Thermomicrobium sp.]
MSGAWLALGVVVGVLVVHTAVLPGLALVMNVLVWIWLVAWRRDRAVRAAALILTGLVVGMLRFGLWSAPARDSTSGRGTVEVVRTEQEATEIVVLRDDGQLVGLVVEGPIVTEIGERVEWTGTYRPGRRAVAGIVTSGMYEVASEGIARRRSSAWLAEVRDWTRGTLLRVVPEPSGSLTLGVLVGDDRGLASPTRERLRRAGLAHLTAVSGWNVAVVASAVEGLLTRVAPWTWLRWLGTGSAVWLYAFLTGFEAPVQRAAAMATLYLVARWRGWPGEPINALGWAVVVLLVLRPELARSLAFQLSTIATAALCVTRVSWVGWRWSELVMRPVLVHFAVTPLLLYRFGTYSVIGPLANVLVEPAIPWLMVAGLLALVGSLLAPWGTVLAAPAWVIGRWVVAVAEWLVSIPGASGLTVGPPEWSLVWLYCTVATAILARIDRGREGA